MFVKLIENKWQVTYFIAKHNHPMVEAIAGKIL
jgi:hypothetical protein